jgi:PIN like domain
MTRRRKTSRKRSAASSIAKRLESAVFYLDESIYSRILSEELERVGMTVRRPRVDVPAGTPDATWLAIAGTQGWIVLMRDQRVRHRALEIQSLKEAKVGAFVLTAGQATAQATADVIVSRLKKIVNISRSERKPFLYTLGIGGALTRVKVR